MESPTDKDIERALKTLEAAGFNVVDGRRLARHQQERRPVHLNTIAAARKGDRDAAMRLIGWFVADLGRLSSPLESAELRRYFAEALGQIVSGKADPATALGLKISRRPISPYIKEKRSRAFHLANELRQVFGDGVAVDEVAAMLNCDVRTVRRYVSEYAKELKRFRGIVEKCGQLNRANNPRGVIVIM